MNPQTINNTARLRNLKRKEERKETETEIAISYISCSKNEEEIQESFGTTNPSYVGDATNLGLIYHFLQLTSVIQQRTIEDKTKEQASLKDLHRKS